MQQINFSSSSRQPQCLRELTLSHCRTHGWIYDPPSMSSFLQADLVLDGYQLVRFLGRGGFGEVWLCRSQAMGDYRALKWIPAGHTDRLEKEYESLLHYRKAAAGLRIPL